MFRAAMPRGTNRCGRFGNGDSIPAGRGEALDLPEQLVHMAARPPIAVRGPLAGRALGPALPDARRLNACDSRLQLIRSLGAPADVAEARRVGLGELERVEEALAPAAEIHRLALTARLLETDHVGVEPRGLLRCRGQDFDVREL